MFTLSDKCRKCSEKWLSQTFQSTPHMQLDNFSIRSLEQWIWFPGHQNLDWKNFLIPKLVEPAREIKPNRSSIQRTTDAVSDAHVNFLINASQIAETNFHGSVNVCALVNLILIQQIFSAVRRNFSQIYERVLKYVSKQSNVQSWRFFFVFRRQK